MFDITLRPLKDRLIAPLCHILPPFVTPLTLTLLAFLSGLLSCYSVLTHQRRILAPTYFLLNRLFDGLDGALARHRNQASDVGGFLDLLGDFIIYSLIPICCGMAATDSNHSDARMDQLQALASLSAADEVRVTIRATWLAIAVLEASFHVNNFVLFYISGMVEKHRAVAKSNPNHHSHQVNELTSLAMRPALIEGFESGVVFTAMLLYPVYVREFAWMMAGLVGVGIMQRAWWLITTVGD